MRRMSLIDIFEKFPTEDDAVLFLENIRWGDQIVCPYCKSETTCPHKEKAPKIRRHQCWTCHRSFSVKVKTIFHRSHLPLRKWFLAICLIMNAKKSLSNLQLGRDLNLPSNTAWFLGVRIRRALQNDPEQREMFQGIIEMDETYVGGKSRKKNKKEDDQGNRRGRGTKKLPVVGIAERDGGVAAEPFDD